MNINIPEMNWVQDGENNGHPIWKLKLEDYQVRLANGYDTGLWSAILNQQALRNPTPIDNESVYSFNTDVEARAHVEAYIERSITMAVEQCMKVLASYTDIKELDLDDR